MKSLPLELLFCCDPEPQEAGNRERSAVGGGGRSGVGRALNWCARLLQRPSKATIHAKTLVRHSLAWIGDLPVLRRAFFVYLIVNSSWRLGEHAGAQDGHGHPLSRAKPSCQASAALVGRPGDRPATASQSMCCWCTGS